jgi:hypothetical protein
LRCRPPCGGGVSLCCHMAKVPLFWQI